MIVKKAKKRFVIAGLIFALCVISYVSCKITSLAADYVFVPSARIISAPMKALNSILPISFFEIFIILLIPLFVLYVTVTVKKTKEYTDREFWWSQGSMLALTASILLSLYLALYGLPCMRTPVIDVMYDGEKTSDTDMLYEMTLHIVQEANENRKLAGEFDFEDTASKIKTAFETSTDKYDYLKGKPSRPKKSLFSVPLSYLSITGIYMPFTAEAHISTDNPDFVIPFTMAHEMAHSTFVAREDEANFFAYLICMETDDALIEYSANFEAMIYCINALYEVSPEKCEHVVQTMSEGVLEDLRINIKHIDSYEGTSTKIGEFVNDIHLKLSGQEGTESYNLVVELLLKWYEQK